MRMSRITLLRLLIAVGLVYLVVQYFYYIVEVNITDSAVFPKERPQRPAQPPVVLLWTTWRSGSSFVGRILSRAVSDTFYRQVVVMTVSYFL